MTDKIKSAFGAIRAEDSLKAATLRRLHERVESKARPHRYLGVKRLVAAAAVILLIIAAGVFSHRLYFTEAAYIDLDINPSVELVVNRFDRVIGASAYNADGEALLAGLNLRHKKVDVALNEIIQATGQAGILQNEGLVSVTVQALSGNGARLLANIQAEVTASVSHHNAVQVDVFPVDSDTRSAAHDQHISPAMYLAILELQAVDPTATIDECRNHTIMEIRQLTQNHGKGHHGGRDTGEPDMETEEEAGRGTGEESSGEIEVGGPSRGEEGDPSSSGHHGNGHGGRHE